MMPSRHTTYCKKIAWLPSFLVTNDRDTELVVLAFTVLVERGADGLQTNRN